MMNLGKLGLVVLVIGGLAACGNPNETAIKGGCTALMADPQVNGELLRSQISADAFCDCAAVTLTSGSEAETAANVLAMNHVAAELEAGKGGEDMFRDLREARDAEGASAETIALYDAVDELGEQFEDVLDGMMSNGGACGVSAS